MSALNWDPSKSLFGPWNDPVGDDEPRPSGNSHQRRKERRADGWRATYVCRHGRRVPRDSEGCGQCQREMYEAEAQLS